MPWKLWLSLTAISLQLILHISMLFFAMRFSWLLAVPTRVLKSANRINRHTSISTIHQQTHKVLICLCCLHGLSQSKVERIVPNDPEALSPPHTSFTEVASVYFHRIIKYQHFTLVSFCFTQISLKVYFTVILRFLSCSSTVTLLISNFLLFFHSSSLFYLKDVVISYPWL